MMQNCSVDSVHRYWGEKEKGKGDFKGHEGW